MQKCQGRQVKEQKASFEKVSCIPKDITGRQKETEEAERGKFEN